MWCHFDNTGPRTTNHAEGYHNKLNIADLRNTNLAVRNFLQLLQPLHNRDQIRQRNLQRGAFQPKQRDPTYFELDNRILQAKINRFADVTGYLWNVPHFDAYMLPPNDFQILAAEVHAYLRFMSHLIGKISRVVFNEQ